MTPTKRSRKPCMRPNEPWPAWRERSALDMVNMARTFLYLHGFLSEAENDRVKERVRKWRHQPGSTPPSGGTQERGDA